MALPLSTHQAPLQGLTIYWRCVNFVSIMNDKLKDHDDELGIIHSIHSVTMSRLSFSSKSLVSSLLTVFNDSNLCQGIQGYMTLSSSRNFHKRQNADFHTDRKWTWVQMLFYSSIIEGTRLMLQPEIFWRSGALVDHDYWNESTNSSKSFYLLGWGGRGIQTSSGKDRIFTSMHKNYFAFLWLP